MKTIYTIILFTLSVAALGQANCFCGKLYDDNLQKPDTIIRINGVESYAICGYFEDDFVSEFTVTKCGDEKILDFYDATLNYKIKVDSDTLKLIDYRFLLSRDLSNFVKAPWAIDMYYESRGNTIHERKVVYSEDNLVVLTKDFHKEWENEINKEWSMNDKLTAWTFLISLNNEEFYKKYFENYRDSIQIGGQHAEYYKELKRMYNELND